MPYENEILFLKNAMLPDYANIYKATLLMIISRNEITQYSSIGRLDHRPD